MSIAPLSTSLLELVEVHGERTYPAQRSSANCTNRRQASCSDSRHAPSRCGSTRPVTGTRSAIVGHRVEQPGPDGGQRGGARGRRVGQPLLDRRRRSRRPGAGAAQARWSDRRRRAAPPPAPTRARRRSRRPRARRSPRAPRARPARAWCPRSGRRSCRARRARHHGAPTPVMPGRMRTPSALVGAARQLAERRRVGGEAELAAQPLEHLAGREHAAVERVLLAAADAPCDRSAAGRRRAPAPGRRRARARRRRSRRWPSRGPATTQPAPASAACWSTTRAVSGSSTGQRS